MAQSSKRNAGVRIEIRVVIHIDPEALQLLLGLLSSLVSTCMISPMRFGPETLSVVSVRSSFMRANIYPLPAGTASAFAVLAREKERLARDLKDAKERFETDLGVERERAVQLGNELAAARAKAAADIAAALARAEAELRETELLWSITGNWRDPSGRVLNIVRDGREFKISGGVAGNFSVTGVHLDGRAIRTQVTLQGTIYNCTFIIAGQGPRSTLKYGLDNLKVPSANDLTTAPELIRQ
jgi:hypothetical protein